MSEETQPYCVEIKIAGKKKIDKANRGEKIKTWSNVRDHYHGEVQEGGTSRSRQHPRKGSNSMCAL